MVDLRIRISANPKSWTLFLLRGKLERPISPILLDTIYRTGKRKLEPIIIPPGDRMGQQLRLHSPSWRDQLADIILSLWRSTDPPDREWILDKRGCWGPWEFRMGNRIPHRRSR